MQVSNSSVSVTTGNRLPLNGTKATNSTTTEQASSTPASQVQLSEAAQNMRDTDKLPRYLRPVEGYADPHASSGSIYDFLKPSDQKVLKEAYDYALNNGNDLKKVEEAAFYLGGLRHKQAQIATGTKHSTYVPDKYEAFVNARPEDRAQELEKLLQQDPDNKLLKRIQRADQGNFFGSNPILNQALFTDAVDDQLGPYRANATSNNQSSNAAEDLLFQHLRRSDRSELSKAYQTARDNDLDPDEVKKAAFLLAIERLNENMTNTLNGNSTAGQAVKTSSELFKNEIDTPNKLIELAEKVLGEDAADSFRQLVGRPSAEEVFGRNSTLRQALFLAPAYNLLNMTVGT